MKPNRKKLVFVYNADGGLFNLLGDTAHKIFSPETYACNLCALTHGNFGMKREWRAFLETVPVDVEFMHADEFRVEYPNQKAEKLPAVFMLENNLTSLMIDTNEINACRTLNDLKQIISARLESLLAG